MRELVEVFMDKFMTEYQGPLDIVNILESLIVYTRQYPKLDNLTEGLKWLECRKNLERNFYALYNEEAMSGFPSYVRDKMLQDRNLIDSDQIHDALHKLIDLCLYSRQYYNLFKTYCKERPALHKYVRETTEFPRGVTCYVSILEYTPS